MEDSPSPNHQRRIIIMWAIMLVLGLVVQLWGLGSSLWATDEPVYRNAGYSYVVDHNFTPQPGHPPIGKMLIGLSEMAFGTNAFATRLPSALAALFTGLLLGWFAAHLSRKQWAAPLVFALWLLMPHPDYFTNHTQLAYLDPFMSLFMVLGIIAAWRWMNSGSLRWMTLAGVAMGLSLTSKAPGILTFVIVGCIWLVGAVPRLRNLVEWPRAPRIWQIIVMFAIGGITAAFAYLPMQGAAIEVITYMLRHQRCHADAGAMVKVAGHSYQHAPWWSFFWWEWNEHPIVAVVQAAAIPAAWIVLSRKIALLLSIATIPAVAFVVVSPVKLFHYSYIYEPFIALAIGLIIVALVQRWRWIGLSVAVVLVVVMTGGWFKDVALVRLRGTNDDVYRVYHATSDALARYDNPDNLIASNVARTERMTFRSLTVPFTFLSAKTAEIALYTKETVPDKEAIADMYPSDTFRRVNIAGGENVMFVRRDAAKRDIHMPRGQTHMPEKLWLCRRLSKRRSLGQ